MFTFASPVLAAEITGSDMNVGLFLKITINIQYLIGITEKYEKNGLPGLSIKLKETQRSDKIRLAMIKLDSFLR